MAMKKTQQIRHTNYGKPSDYDDELPTYEENLYFKNETADDFFGENGKAPSPSSFGESRKNTETVSSRSKKK